MKFLTTTFERLRRSRTPDGTAHQIAVVQLDRVPLAAPGAPPAQAAQLEIDITDSPQRMIVSLCPKVTGDTSQARDLGPQLIQLIDHDRPGVLVLDLGQLTQLSSECLNQLISVNCHARSQGVQLVLANLCEPLHAVFRITRLDRLFELIDQD